MGAVEGDGHVRKSKEVEAVSGIHKAQRRMLRQFLQSLRPFQSSAPSRPVHRNSSQQIVLVSAILTIIYEFESARVVRALVMLFKVSPVQSFHRKS